MRTKANPLDRGVGDLAAGAAGVSLNIAWPDTPARWEDWLRRRERFRIAAGRWAARQAIAEYPDDPEAQWKMCREIFLDLLDRLELTRVDDEQLREKYHRRPVPRTPGRRAMGSRERRGG